ncbi:hypothetical protein V7S43_013084 [Phytophthora oleae]|uniref:Uncharacterized protein n=1 Tax=Phytophthora oleae TaxID=2107226 RepID=A0ABD3F9S1_9STRA
MIDLTADKESDSGSTRRTTNNCGRKAECAANDRTNSENRPAAVAPVQAPLPEMTKTQEQQMQEKQTQTATEEQKQDKIAGQQQTKEQQTTGKIQGSTTL